MWAQSPRAAQRRRYGTGMRQFDRTVLSGLVLLVFLWGYGTGRIVSVETSASPPLTVWAASGAARIPVVSIDGVSGIRGTINGNVRVFAGNVPVVADAHGAFAVAAARRGSPSAAASTAPAGMRYVASKRGKKYYAVGSKAAAKLSPANLIYFPDGASAERAGYKR